MAYPWSIPALKNLYELDFKSPITFLVGGNGVGKSTLLEGLAYGMGAYVIGSIKSMPDDPFLKKAEKFASSFYFSKKLFPKTKAFLRAEDVYGFIKSELDEAYSFQLESEESAGNTYGSNLLQAISKSIINTTPYEKSHGEKFLQILESRLHDSGLFFLDEPESPLSPMKQLILTKLIQSTSLNGAQYIIATHSPILLSLPGATIYQINESNIQEVPYNEVESVVFMKSFLNRPDLFIGSVADSIT